jgi:glyoxylase-like metal-dependent hydrolase (beta-lactamase superfamily II)
VVAGADVSAGADALRVRVEAVGPLGANAVLVAAGDDAVLIDPGGEAGRLLDALAASGAQLREIWLTHAHVDHLGALQDVVDALGPLPVRMHPDDGPLYRDAPAWAAGLGLAVRAPTVATRPLSDGEELRVGALRARCRHLPGHAPGHVVFLFEEAGLVVAGDTLFRGSIGRTDLPYGDEEALLRGIRERLLILPDGTRVVPGHGPATTVGEERRTNPFLAGAQGSQRNQPER